jgi:hypothetical protein
VGAEISEKESRARKERGGVKERRRREGEGVLMEEQATLEEEFLQANRDARTASARQGASKEHLEWILDHEE